jgi:glycosyltransferase 2 family protein
VQVGLTVAVLLVLPSPVRAAMPLVAVALLVAAVGVVAIARMPIARDVRDAVGRDLRGGPLARQAWPAIALASALVVAGHAMTSLSPRGPPEQPRHHPGCCR